ncbi:hypothetical protein GCM10010528_21090 [Gordonia defluvii]|uniref:Uncharacterized protein n=1 Tax=Gordonia defluvii TaxID=283718 RepID=A0ABP6LEM7_9ACTN
MEVRRVSVRGAGPGYMDGTLPLRLRLRPRAGWAKMKVRRVTVRFDFLMTHSVFLMTHSG